MFDRPKSKQPEGAPGNPDEQGDPLKRMMDMLGMDDVAMRVKMNDDRLMKLAEYDVLEGYTKTPQPEDQPVLVSRFAEFKGLVKRGEETLKQLETFIYEKHGITEGSRADPVSSGVIHGFACPEINDLPDDLDELPVGEISEDAPENH